MNTTTLSSKEKSILLKSIRSIEDYPKKGVVFKDITTLLGDAHAFNTLMQHLKNRYSSYDIDFVAGIDARGFIFGAALAQMLGVGFVPIRKKGKLPYTTYNEKYALEYGTDEVEVHIDAFSSTLEPRVLLIDDLVATGGTALAAAKLINQAGAHCVEACFIMGLDFLDGINKVNQVTPVYTVLKES